MSPLIHAGNRPAWGVVDLHAKADRSRKSCISTPRRIPAKDGRPSLWKRRFTNRLPHSSQTMNAEGLFHEPPPPFHAIVEKNVVRETLPPQRMVSSTRAGSHPSWGCRRPPRQKRINAGPKRPHAKAISRRGQAALAAEGAFHKPQTTSPSAGAGYFLESRRGFLFFRFLSSSARRRSSRNRW